jgi:hypothetical protein
MDIEVSSIQAIVDFAVNLKILLNQPTAINSTL